MASRSDVSCRASGHHKKTVPSYHSRIFLGHLHRRWGLGRAGAIRLVQLGSAYRSVDRQCVSYHPEKMRIPTCCGSAAGISGHFNAPWPGCIYDGSYPGRFHLPHPDADCGPVRFSVSRFPSFSGRRPLPHTTEYLPVSVYMNSGIYVLLRSRDSVSPDFYKKVLYKIEDRFAS